jgi:hypothetical protein
MDKLATSGVSTYRTEGPQNFIPTPLQRLDLWLATNAKLPTNFSDADIGRVIERLNTCGIGEDIKCLDFTAIDANETLCEDCGEIIIENSSPAVWLHDPEALGDRAYNLNEAHAARPPEENII